MTKKYLQAHNFEQPIIQLKMSKKFLKYINSYLTQKKVKLFLENKNIYCKGVVNQGFIII